MDYRKIYKCPMPMGYMEKEKTIEKINNILNGFGFEGTIRESKFIFSYSGYFKNRDSDIEISVNLGCYEEKKEGNWEVNLKLPFFEGSSKRAELFIKNIEDSLNAARSVEKAIIEGGEF